MSVPHLIIFFDILNQRCISNVNLNRLIFCIFLFVKLGLDLGPMFQRIGFNTNNKKIYLLNLNKILYV